MQQGHVEIERRLAVWRVECAVLCGMLIEAKGQAESLLDACCWAFDIHHHAVGGGVDHGEAIGFREMEDGCIVRLGGAKSGGELSYAEVLAVAGTLRIVDLLEQSVEVRFIAQRQGDGQA